MTEHNRPGFCACCDALMFEVAKRHMEGPLKGEVAEFGQILAGVHRTTMVTVSGKRLSIDLCGDCQLDDETTPKVWRRVMAAFALEHDEGWRLGRGCKPSTPEQVEKRRETILNIIRDIPIGVLYSQDWGGIARG